MITSETGDTGLEFLGGYRRLLVEDAIHEEWLDEAIKREPVLRTMCRRGHPLDGVKPNHDGTVVRFCKTCHRERSREAARARRKPTADQAEAKLPESHAETAAKERA